MVAFSLIWMRNCAGFIRGQVLLEPWHLLVEICYIFFKRFQTNVGKLLKFEILFLGDTNICLRKKLSFNFLVMFYCIELQLPANYNLSKNTLRLSCEIKYCRAFMGSLITDFNQFSSVISKFLFLEGRLGTMAALNFEVF